MLDKDFLKEFEEGFNPLNPEMSKIPANIIGYGEISVVMSINERGYENFVLKRLPIFENYDQLKHYEGVFREYTEIIKNKIGIKLPEEDCFSVSTDDERFVFYTVQERFPGEWVANRIIHRVSKNGIEALLFNIFRNLKKIWEFNESSENVKIGFDGQVPNWVVKDFSLSENESEKLQDATLIYIDTSTPLIRKAGEELLPAELFLKSVPFGLRTIVKKLFLQEILDRYYNLRLVVLDIIANLFKEFKPVKVKEMVDTANRFFVEEMDEKNPQLLDFDKILKYYKRDAFIWSLFLRLRKMERFIKTRILQRRYDYVLPPEIVRFVS